MASTTEKKIDRSNWPAGPWDDEPDRVEFRHAGLPCLLRRNRSGAWCGYAAVMPGHPLHGKGYSEDEVNIEVHGGLTYADACQGDICHVPPPGEPDNVWWFGFDCAHAWDIVPERKRSWGATYRDLRYVRLQTEQLAEQLAAKS